MNIMMNKQNKRKLYTFIYIKEATSVTEFKSLLSKWPGPKCQCGYCVLCRIYNIQMNYQGLKYFIHWTRMWSLYFYVLFTMPVLFLQCIASSTTLFLFWLFWFNTDELNCMCVLNCFHHLFACIIPSVILIQSPNSHRLMLFVCSLCDSK